MEVLFRFVAVPITLVTSIVFCLLAYFTLNKMPVLLGPTTVISKVLIVLVSVSFAIGIWPGPKVAFEQARLFYWAFYAGCLIVGPPAVAAFLMAVAIKKDEGKKTALYLPTLACWFTCVTLVFWDLYVSEAIYGPQ